MSLLVDPCLSADELRLRDLVSEVSEAAYHSGWQRYAEFDVWRLATEGGAWGHATAKEIEGTLSEAVALATRLNRWVIWSEKPGCDNEAVPLPHWQRRYRAWRGGVIAYGCAYCADDQNRLFGHVAQVAANDESGILLECPRCSTLYLDPADGSDAKRIALADATVAFPGWKSHDIQQR